MNTNIIVAITQGVYEKGKDVYERGTEKGLICIPVPADETGLAAAVKEQGAKHAVIGITNYADALYEALPGGGVLARFGVGYDNINLARATEKGLLCTNTPGVLEDSVAEMTIALILSAARHVPEMNESTRKGGWTPRKGMELRGKRIAVIGCGQIGCSVARIASAGFGMEVIGCEISDVDTEKMKREHGFSLLVKDFAEAVNLADFVTLHIPSIPATHHFINTRRLETIPRKAWLINTSRGTVADETALYDAIESGSLSGAALDVFETEPYVPAEPEKDLRKLPNVILVPHVSSYTEDACRRIADRTLQNIVLAERCEFEKIDLLNPEVLRNEK